MLQSVRLQRVRHSLWSEHQQKWFSTLIWESVFSSRHLSLSKLGELVMDREAWRTAVHGISKSRICLSNRTEPGKNGWAGIKMKAQQGDSRAGASASSPPPQPHPLGSLYPSRTPDIEINLPGEPGVRRSQQMERDKPSKKTQVKCVFHVELIVVSSLLS